MLPTGAYGSWPSPIDASLAAAHDGFADDLGMVGDDLNNDVLAPHRFKSVVAGQLGGTQTGAVDHDHPKLPAG